MRVLRLRIGTIPRRCLMLDPDVAIAKNSNANDLTDFTSFTNEVRSAKAALLISYVHRIIIRVDYAWFTLNNFLYVANKNCKLDLAKIFGTHNLDISI